MLRGNICWKCQHWQECFKYRYGNKKQEYMKKIKKAKDSWGETVIYVLECEKYEYEKQSDLHNIKNKRMCDIMYLAGNYFNNNLGDRYN